MKPKKMADLSFFRMRHSCDRYLKTGGFFSPFYLFAFSEAEPSRESLEELQHSLSQRLPSRSSPSGSLPSPAEHFRSCIPTGVNDTLETLLDRIHC